MGGTSNADVRPDEVLGGRYRIEERIGAGGAAKVYRATDLRLRRPVAVKVVNPFLSRIPRAAERFVREARAMAALDSPYLVPIYDVGADGERLYLVLKLLEGELFEDRMRAGPVPAEEAAAIASDVLVGLETLHEAGMVHRDVKPSNVFVTREGRGVLLDLGIVLDDTERHLTDKGMVLGTPEFMAPEHAIGQDADARSDIYATALMLLFAITGKRGGVTSDCAVSRRVKGDGWLGPVLGRVPPGWRPILRQALSRERIVRTRSAADLRAALLSASMPAQWSGPSSWVRDDLDEAETSRVIVLANGTRPGPADVTAPATPLALARSGSEAEPLAVADEHTPATGGATPLALFALMLVAVVAAIVALVLVG